jgi:hypothetical protein
VPSPEKSHEGLILSDPLLTIPHFHPHAQWEKDRKGQNDLYVTSGWEICSVHEHQSLLGKPTNKDWDGSWSFYMSSADNKSSWLQFSEHQLSAHVIQCSHLTFPTRVIRSGL